MPMSDFDDDPFSDVPTPNVVAFPTPDDVPDWLDEVPPHGAEVTPIRPISASPFVWRQEADIPPRQWVYGHHLLRKFVSVDVAAGGVGKSSVKIGEALAMASNEPIYGDDIHGGPLTVWIFNLEDPLEETERRIHATAKRFGIQPDALGNRLYVDSGRDQKLVLAEEREFGGYINAPVAENLIAEIKSRRIDVLILDPFVSSHALSENDNRAIDAVSKEWGRIADVCNCSINLVHHVRKTNGTETNTDSARGAKSLTDAARSVMVYNRMSETEAQNAGIPEAERSFYFRVANDKANLAPPNKAKWFRMNNVDLANGDRVGVACPWQWPDIFDGITLANTKEVQRAVAAETDARADSRSSEWVGNIIGAVLSMDPSDTQQRAKIGLLLKEWVRTDVLRIVEKTDSHRKVRKCVEVGRWITD